jgi:hypothetical protein
LLIAGRTAGDTEADTIFDEDTFVPEGTFCPRTLFEIDSLLEGAATGAACAIALALPVKSCVFAVEEAEGTGEASAGLPNSDCCASIFAAARCAIARADRASDLTLATPAAVLEASVGGVANRDGAGGAAEIGPREPVRPTGSAGAAIPEEPDPPKTTVGIFVSDGFAEALDDGVATRRLPLARGA